MDQLLRKHAEKLRFAVVGGANTVLDFALLFLFTSLGINKYLANIFSTGIAFVFSFFVNKSFTFKNNDKNVKKQFALFAIVTLSGLWILQPFVIWVSTLSLEPSVTDENILLFIAKIIATVASLVWNYLFYSRLVFKKGLKESS